MSRWHIDQINMTRHLTEAGFPPDSFAVVREWVNIAKTDDPEKWVIIEDSERERVTPSLVTHIVSQGFCWGYAPKPKWPKDG